MVLSKEKITWDDVNHILYVPVLCSIYIYKYIYLLSSKLN
jgi:hypothetical protein